MGTNFGRGRTPGLMQKKRPSLLPHPERFRPEPLLAGLADRLGEGGGPGDFAPTHRVCPSVVPFVGEVPYPVTHRGNEGQGNLAFRL